jgi:hypothetical protein
MLCCVMLLIVNLTFCYFFFARLPVGDSGGQKMAKIPEPWQLQLPLPHPCKYFLRMKIFKHTSVSDIVNAASTNCKLPANCFGLYVSDKEIAADNYSLTSEELALFQSGVAIEVLPFPQCEKRD